MPQSSRWPATAPEVVYVIDSCALINMKDFSLVKHHEQFPMFARMTQLLDEGRLALPRQVAAEMSHIRYADIPGGWATGYQAHCRYPQPVDETMADVLGAAQLLDPQGDSEFQEADPYVVAMALEIRDHYPQTRVIVVSDDVKDRLPRKESVQTACDALELECQRSSDFVAFMRTVLAGP